MPDAATRPPHAQHRQWNATGFQRENGFFLLEVLIAAMLLATALAGMAGTLNISLRNEQGAVFRQTANLLARDMAERIHANPGAWAAYAHAGASAAPAADCHTGACGAAERARADLAEWSESLRLRLPGGQGQLQATSQGAVLVTIRWHQRPGRGAQASAGIASHEFTVRP